MENFSQCPSDRLLEICSAFPIPTDHKEWIKKQTKRQIMQNESLFGHVETSEDEDGCALAWSKDSLGIRCGAALLHHIPLTDAQKDQLDGNIDSLHYICNITGLVCSDNTALTFSNSHLLALRVPINDTEMGTLLIAHISGEDLKKDDDAGEFYGYFVKHLRQMKSLYRPFLALLHAMATEDEVRPIKFRSSMQKIQRHTEVERSVDFANFNLDSLAFD